MEPVSFRSLPQPDATPTRAQEEKVQCASTEAFSLSQLPTPDLSSLEAEPSTERKDPFTPAVSYPLRRSPSSGKIRVQLTPGIKQRLKQRIPQLYRIKRARPEDRSMEERLIGVTEQPDGRLGAYLSGFNNPEKAGTRLARDVSAHPDKFEFGLIRSLSQEEDMGEAETAAIVAKDSIRHGYNLRKGGGGGRARKTTPEQQSPYTLDEVVAMIEEDYHSPEFKLFKRDKGRLVPTLFESDEKRKNVVYEFLFDPTSKKEDRTHHVGYTTTSLKKRMSNHASNLNNPQSRGARTISLYQEMLGHEKDVKIRVFNTEKLREKGVPAWQLEQAFMQFFEQRGEKVRNAGAGGKGSVSHDSV